MRLSTSSSNYIVISCCDALLVSDKRQADLSPSFIHLPRKVADEQTARNATQCNKLETDASKSGDHEQVEEKEVVVGCCLSNSEQLLGAITSHKRLLVWCCPDPASWLLSHCWQLVKRPVDLIFDTQGLHVLVADKTGDVLNFSLDEAGKDQVLSTDDPPSDGQDEQSPAPLLLGHLSMLLSLAMSECGRYVASSDRDEKIRVSSYPRAHNVASFCLGHSEFVVQLRALPSFPAILLSASGDGTLRLWNFGDGEELSVLDTHQHSQPVALNASPGPQNGQHAASAAAGCKDAQTCSFNKDDGQSIRDDSQSNKDDSQGCRNDCPGNKFDISGNQDGSQDNKCDSQDNKCDSQDNKCDSQDSNCDSQDNKDVSQDNKDVSQDNKNNSQDNKDDIDDNKNDSESNIDDSLVNTNGRDRVVPKQRAIVSVAVTTDPAREGTDVVAAVFDKSKTVALYGVSEDRKIWFRCRASLPRPASTVSWLSPDTLVTVCPPATSVPAALLSQEPCLAAADDSSPVLVWRWDGEELTCLPHHPLSVFTAQHRHRFQGLYVVDPQVLYKQRYDNVADYQKKKQVRLLQQAEHRKQVQEQQQQQQTKRPRLADPAGEMS